MANKGEMPAYDLSLFDGSEAPRMASAEKQARKKRRNGKILSISKGSSAKTHRRQRNPVLIGGTILVIALVGLMVMSVLQKYARINELNDTLTSLQVEYQQLVDQEGNYRVTIDTYVTDAEVRRFAEEELGMVAASKTQKKYISLSVEDKGTVYASDQTFGVFDFMYEAFGGVE